MFFTVKRSILYEGLLDYLGKNLPSYSIPRRFYIVKDVALTSNNKIDRAGLVSKVIEELKSDKLPIMNSQVQHNKPSPIKIAIVGGGAASVSLSETLHNVLKQTLTQPVEITIFEKGSTIGAGIPYDIQQASSCILNLPKGGMEPVEGEKGIFSNWLKTQPDSPQNTESTSVLIWAISTGKDDAITSNYKIFRIAF